MIVSCVAPAICLIVSLAVGEANAKKSTTTITGEIKTAEKYRGKVRSVYIEVDGGDAFLVARGTYIGKELCKRVGATVTATGYVREADRDPDFDGVIDILSYEAATTDDPAPGQP